MALVKYGGGIIQMSGSIAGDVHARNRFGNYIRPRTKPINPNSAGQVAVRSAMAILVERWSETLTIIQRTAWNLYASSVSMKNRLGENMNVTGMNMYIRGNAFRARYAKPIIDDGPTTFTLPEADPAFGISAGEVAQQISVSFDDTLDWDNEDNGFLVYQQGSPQNGQRNFFAGPWRVLSFTAGATGAPVASPVVEAAVFAIAQNQKLWCQARIYRADGRTSSQFTAQCIVGA